MMKDGAKPTSLSAAEEIANRTEIAEQRKLALQVAAAQLFARSLILCADRPLNLQEQLIIAQENFFSEFSRIVPVTLQQPDQSVTEQLKTLDIPLQRLLIIANHPPYEKTVSPTDTQLMQALRELHRDEIIPTLQNMQNLPAGIARRAIIHQILSSIYPDYRFQYHVVGAKYRPPLHVVQEEDGTIIVPYAQKGAGGFDQLLHGLHQTFNYDEKNSGSRIPIVVAFPEGEQPQTIEQLKPFHSGPFAAAAHVFQETNIPITVLPMVMAVRDDFAVETKVLTPRQITLGLTQKETAQKFATALQQDVQTAYTNMLQSLPGYYWRGMTYPFGGLSRQQITNL